MMTRSSTRGIFVIGAIVLFSAHAQAAIWYVDKYHTTGTEDGTSWATAFNTVQEGIDAASGAGGGEVWLRAGNYNEARTGVEPGSGVECGSLMLADGVSLYGGFAGNETARSQRDWERFETVIDGSTSRGGQPAIHVIQAVATSVLDGLSITGGYADSGGLISLEDYGAAVYLRRRSSGAPAISAVFQNCRFHDNYARSNAGAVYQANAAAGGAGSSVTYTNCIFARNQGGVITADGVLPVLDGCTFSENAGEVVNGNFTPSSLSNCTFSANSGTPLKISLFTTVTNCTFVGNISFYDQTTPAGGAAWSFNASTSFNRCSFIGNRSYNGGAVWLSGATGTLSDCVFVDNHAENAGGAIYIEGGSPSLVRCVFRGNTSAGRGGALAIGQIQNNFSTTATITDCILLDNETGQIGGALHAMFSTVTVRNCTVWNNSAPLEGGGLFFTSMVSSSVINSILRNNTVDQYATHFAGAPTFSYCNVQGGVSGTGNIDQAVTFVDEPAGDLRLTSGSPGVNTGTNTGASATDIRGVTRPTGGTVDMGAYEYTASAVSPSVIVNPVQLEFPLGERVQPLYNGPGGGGARAAFEPKVFPSPPTPNLIEFHQPDGTTFEGWLRGSEYFSWVETTEGWLAIRDPDSGMYEYMTLDKHGEIVPSGIPVGSANSSRTNLVQDPFLLQTAIEARIGQRAETRYPEVFPDNHCTPTSGTVKSLVIMVNYSNTTTTYTQADINGLFNTAGYTGHGSKGSVRDYYIENSYGNINFQFTATGWFTLSQPDSFYTIGDDQSRMQMAAEALDLLDASGFDFSTMDGDGDGWVDNVVILHQGTGAEAGSGFMWSHAGLIPTRTYDGKSIDVYSTVPEMYGAGLSTIGVIAHEIGHTFGLPDLYDGDYSSPGIGQWGLMGTGTLLDDGRTPAHFCAWSKAFLGWLNPTVLSANQNGVSVPASEGSPTAYRIDAGMPAGEYLLIENRRQTGFDAYLPGEGLFVWHIDDKTYGNTFDLRRAVDLLGADEAIQGNPDAGANPFPGTIPNRSLNGSSTPSSDSNLWGDTGISLSNISNPGATMTFDFAYAAPNPTRTLSIGNLGMGPLSVTGLSKSPSASWLTLDAAAPFSVAPGGAPAVLQLTSDLSLSPPGETEITLTVTSNSATKATDTIPVLVQDFKAGVPSITDSLSPSTDVALGFGNQPRNTVSSATVTVTNSGSETLTVTDFSLEGDTAGAFAITTKPTLPAAVAPAGSIQFRVRYAPPTQAAHQAVVVITSDSSKTNVVPMLLSGAGTATVADSDGDGISDASEGMVLNTDGDGLLNYLDSDSDNDGVSDGVEAAWGTNALNAASVPLLYTVFVDFAYTGLELLTSSKPANTLTEGAAGVASNGIVTINGASADTASPEVLTITRKMLLESTGGTVRIGMN